MRTSWHLHATEPRDIPCRLQVRHAHTLKPLEMFDLCTTKSIDLLVLPRGLLSELRVAINDNKRDDMSRVLLAVAEAAAGARGAR